jgi:hypothetical protein
MSMAANMASEMTARVAKHIDEAVAAQIEQPAA